MARAEQIAFLCPRFAGEETVGGAERLLRALADRAAGAGRRVTFLTTCARDHFSWRNELPEGPRRIGNLDVQFFRVDEDRDIEAFLQAQERISRRAPFGPEDEQTWLRNNVNSRALIEHLTRHGDSYDRLVMGPYLFGLVYFASQVHPRKTLLVPCLHDEAFAYMAAMRGMFRGVAGCMFNTEAERDLAVRLYGLEHQARHVVGMGIDSFTCNPGHLRQSRGVDAPCIVYSGRREPLKGTPLLIDYFGTFRARTGRDVRLVLTGSGPVEVPDALRPFVLDLGFVSEQEKHDVMAGAICFCHPSVNESLSIVLLESWLAGVPALVHAGGEVLRSQCRRSGGGLWFHSYPEFEEELLLLLERPEIRGAMGAAGKAFVQREYGWDEIERRLLRALDEGVTPSARDRT